MSLARQKKKKKKHLGSRQSAKKKKKKGAAQYSYFIGLWVLFTLQYELTTHSVVLSEIIQGLKSLQCSFLVW